MNWHTVYEVDERLDAAPIGSDVCSPKLFLRKTSTVRWVVVGGSKDFTTGQLASHFYVFDTGFVIL